MTRVHVTWRFHHCPLGRNNGLDIVTWRYEMEGKMAPEGEDEHRSVEKEQVVDETEDETLKYHLLGPSLTKAGQDAVDQRKVSDEASRW